uniref:Uncharacterized protein n=1 Tax=Cacopsylla melanoneura TaxID=428564 RepID=A0A8D8S2Q2_9HEMI
MLPSKKPKLFLNQHDDVMNCYLRSKYFTKTGVGERGVVTGRTLSHRQRQRPRAVTTQAPASVATASCTINVCGTHARSTRSKSDGIPSPITNSVNKTDLVLAIKATLHSI